MLQLLIWSLLVPFPYYGAAIHNLVL